jgi:hypothetical protein
MHGDLKAEPLEDGTTATRRDFASSGTKTALRLALTNNSVEVIGGAGLLSRRHESILMQRSSVVRSCGREGS